MTNPTILVSTWSDGVSALVGDTRTRELSGRCVRGLTDDGRGGAIAIVEGHSLHRRDAEGSWNALATSDDDLSCCVSWRDAIYVGTDDAKVLHLGANGKLTPLPGFDRVPGRETWYAGQALVDGRMLGPPLGIRSITATVDGVLLANVHVGGIPRSTDGGATWHATIDVESDVHEVRAHPERPEIVMAAAAIGLCISRDGGATWVIEDKGLHATHGSAVAFAGGDVLLSASESPFDPKGAIYRRRLDGDGSMIAVGGGLPEWLDGAADTGCIAANGAMIALADRGGNVYVSPDGGRSWSRRASGLSAPSGVLIL